MVFHARGNVHVIRVILLAMRNSALIARDCRRRVLERGYLLPRRMLMCRLPLMTVQPCRDWAASTESIVLVSQTLSHNPSHALQNILQVGERGRRRQSKCQGQVPATHTDSKQANGSEPWQDYCVSPKHEVYLRLVFDKHKVTALWGFMHLTESSLEPGFYVKGGSLNQQWGKTRSGSTSKKLHGKVN